MIEVVLNDVASVYFAVREYMCQGHVSSMPGSPILSAKCETFE